MSDQTLTGRIVIAGGSGFLGRSLASFLSDAHPDVEVVIFSRHEPRQAGPWRHVAWDARSLDTWVDTLDGAAAVVNLAGRSVDCIKTPDHCDEILRSRVEATTVLGQAMAEVSAPPPTWVQMSTAHIYGDPPELVCDESSAFGDGLAPRVGEAWEAACRQHARPDQRVVFLRTSFVLGRTGGALSRLATLARWGLGGTVGHGRQGISWIHETDMNRVFVRALSNEAIRDAYVVTAPEPVSNMVFMRSLRRALRQPIGLPAAAWMVRIGAPLVMRTDPELALYGRYCMPTRLMSEGFTFQFPSLEAALRDIYRR